METPPHRADLTSGLTAARLKLDRARTHLDNLKAIEIEFASGPNSNRLLVEYDPDEGCHVIYQEHSMDKFRMPPPVVSLVLGDFVHNVRAALDFITWQLATKRLKRPPTEKEAKKIQFPILPEPEFWNARRSKVLGFISSDAARELASHQPPNGVNGADDPLAILHWISNRDKHRLLIPTTVMSGGGWRYVLPNGITIKKERPFTKPEREAWLFKKGEIDNLDGRPTIGPIRSIHREPLRQVWLTPDDLSPEVELHIDPDLTMAIAFKGPAKHIAMPKLEAIHERVREIIVAFERRFF